MLSKGMEVRGGTEVRYMHRGGYRSHCPLICSSYHNTVMYGSTLRTYVRVRTVRRTGSFSISNVLVGRSEPSLLIIDLNIQAFLEGDCDSDSIVDKLPLNHCVRELRQRPRGLGCLGTASVPAVRRPGGTPVVTPHSIMIRMYGSTCST